jgi:hypothetical protein
VWRDLRQHGAVGVGSGLYALPDLTEYVALLERLTDKISKGGGSAVSFRASALTDADRDAIAEAFGAARHEEYQQVIKSARKLAAHIAQEDDDQLARVVRRDFAGASGRDDAEAAVSAAAERLLLYVENAYRGSDGATESEPSALAAQDRAQ